MPEKTYGNTPPRKVYTVDEVATSPDIRIASDNTHWTLTIDRSTWTGPESVDPIIEIRYHFSNDNGSTWVQSGPMLTNHGAIDNQLGSTLLFSSWTGSLPFVGSKTRKIKFSVKANGTVDFEGTLDVLSGDW